MHHQKKAIIMIYSFQLLSSRCKFYLKIVHSLVSYPLENILSRSMADASIYLENINTLTATHAQAQL